MTKKPTSLVPIIVGILTLSFLFKKTKPKPHEEHHHEPAQSTDEIKPIASLEISDRPIDDRPSADLTKDNSQAKTQEPKRQMSDRRLVTIFTGVIVLFTAASVSVSYFQWRSMEKTLQVSQRGYIVISEIQSDLSGRQIRVLLENRGNVPVEFIDVFVSLKRERRPFDPNNPQLLGWNYYGFGTPFTKIAPGGFKSIAEIPLQNLTDEDVNDLLSGKQELSMFFSITYFDGFDNLETPSFQFKYTPPPHEGWGNMLLNMSEDIKETLRQREEEHKRQAGSQQPAQSP